MTLSLTFNDQPVLQADFAFAKYGAWSATFDVGGESIAKGPAVIKGEDLLFGGTAYEVSQLGGRLACKVVAGAGKMRTMMKAQTYRATPFRIPLADILSVAGETLAAASDRSIVDSYLARWHRLDCTAGTELARLLDVHEGALWRSTDAGELWLGRETWPEWPYDYVVIDDKSGRLTIAGDHVMKLRPGVLLGGRKVGRVELSFSSSSSRAVAWYADDGRDAFAYETDSLVRFRTRQVDFHVPYTARVVAQLLNGTVELKYDDPRLSYDVQVPIRGLPGVTVKVANGARVIVEFENGDPQKPVVTGWDSSSTLVELVVTAGKVTVNAPDVRLGVGASDPVVTQSRLQAALDEMSSWLETHTHTGVTTGAGASGPPGVTSPTPGTLPTVIATGSPNAKAT